MPRTLIKSKLHSNKQKLKIKPDLNKTKSNLPHIYNYLNRNYYPETALLNLNKILIILSGFLLFK